MTDDQGQLDWGFAGHPYVKTPNLDAIAKKSVVFDRFYASSPVCSPTRASFLTGRHAFRTNVLNHGHYLRPQEETLAEALKKHGYVTAHFGKWHVGSVQKESPTSPGQQGFDHWTTGLNFFDNDPYLSENGIFKQFKGKGTVITMDLALQHLRKNHHKSLTFTLIWFPSPHDPHEETPDNPNLYADKPHAPYYREITLIDEQMGRLQKTLKELKIDQETLLWYTSDNGGLVHEHSGGRAKKGSIYEGGLLIPSILHYPQKYSHKRISPPASTSDILPTILSLIDPNYTAQTTLDGINILPMIEDATHHRTHPLRFWHHFTKGQSTWNDRIIKKLQHAQQNNLPNPFPERVHKNTQQFPSHNQNSHQRGHAAQLDWPYKLHLIYKGDQTLTELYHLEKDPLEKINIAKQNKPIVDKMTQALTNWQTAVLKSHSGSDYQPQKNKLKR